MKWVLSLVGVLILVILGCLVMAFWAGAILLALWNSFSADFLSAYGA